MTAPTKQAEQRNDQKQSRNNRTAIIVELVLGVVCAVLWGIFFAIRICHWDNWALLLWASLLLALALLLFRAERNLHAALMDKSQTDDSEKREERT